MKRCQTFLIRTEEKALSRKEIIESVRESLKNLQLDYIDLVIIHKNDPNCPIEGNIIQRILSRKKIFYPVRTIYVF